MAQNQVGQITIRFGLIECKMHYGGNVVSIGLLNSLGEKLFTLGIGFAGTYDFPACLGDEHISLLWGNMAINGQILQVGGTCVVPQDEVVHLEANAVFAYFCRFERRGES